MLTSAKLESALGAFEQIRVAVVGDFYLDRYVIGTADAISREAPIPVVRIEKDLYSPGAAGNTALNLCDLGVKTCAVSVIGKDPAGDILCSELSKRGVTVAGLVAADGRHTPTYTKVYASCFHGLAQQVARFDRENTEKLSPEVEDELIVRLEQTLDEVDAVVLQDQTEVPGAGVITDRVIECAGKRADKVTTGDSRNRLGVLKNLTAVVPNEYEAAVAAGAVTSADEPITEEMVATVGRGLLASLGCQHVIITRGEKGASLFSKGQQPVCVPTVPADGETDVTGAGDTMTAAVTAGLAAGLSVEEATALGNLGAGVTVKKVGTTGTASPDELRAALLRGHEAQRDHPRAGSSPSQ